MRFKYIYLYLNLEEYPDALSTEFGFRTRYVCNYLERGLKEEKFESQGFDRITIQGKHVPEVQCKIVPEHALHVPVAFDEDSYAKMRPDMEHEFYLGMIESGLHKCAGQFSIPLARLASSIEDFRRGGYVNEWTHKTKSLGRSGLKATLQCRLDAERFVLTLILARQGRQVYDAPILETKPDELIFGGRFKDVVLSDGYIVVTDRFGDPTFSLDLEFLKNIQIH